MEEFDGKKRNYQGSLIIVPTPLGNLSDMSLRQFETLTQHADIIACEDTRKTGKMLNMMNERKLRNKFKSQFGVDVDTWADESASVDVVESDQEYYVSEDELNDQRLLNRIQEAYDVAETGEEEAIAKILDALEEEIRMNKFGELDKVDR